MANLKDLQAPAPTTAATSRDGSGIIKIAVIDSGIDTSHPLLNGLDLLDDWSCDQSPAPFGDVCGHGSDVAAIIHQLAPQCMLGSFRILTPDLGTTTEAIRIAALKAIDLGYDILNFSLADGAEGCEAVHAEWVRLAAASGAHVVAALSNVDLEKAQYPAFSPGVIAVAAAEQLMDGAVDYASSASDAIFRVTPYCVRFAASGRMAAITDASAFKPGADLGEFDDEPCSSLAVPRVTAALANILSASGPLSQADALRQLIRTAHPATPVRQSAVAPIT